MKYRVRCIRCGHADIDAECAEAVIDISEKLPNGSFSWPDADDHKAIDKIKY